MTLNQAKIKVATRLWDLNVPMRQRAAIIDMTRDDSIQEAAIVIEAKPDISLEDLKQFIYWPEIN